MTDWARVIDAAHKMTEEHGIAMRGRKYLQVQHRVEAFRLQFHDWGIETTLMHFGRAKGESIVVQAQIKDEKGRIVASGIAEEIRGAGAVNTTSAVENAETSAIGRALACLGLHGGEFASVQEIERATDPAVVSNAREAQEPAKNEGPKPELTSEQRCDIIVAAIDKKQDEAELDGYWSQVEGKLDQIGHAQSERAKLAYTVRKAFLTAGHAQAAE